VSDQSTKEKSYFHVCKFGLAILVSFQISNIFPDLEIFVPYGTVIDHVVTVPEFILLD
jgi:hypothetical protein